MIKKFWATNRDSRLSRCGKTSCSSCSEQRIGRWLYLWVQQAAFHFQKAVSIVKFRLCEKISVNSTTVIKNDIASGLKNSRSIFLQYTINTVICKVSSTVSLLKWSVAEWKQTDRAGSAQSVGVHDLQLAKNSAPVSQRHRTEKCTASINIME